jgi:nitrite reductase (NADH) small subunit
LAEFIKIAVVDDIPRASGKKIKINGKYIALFKYGNKIYAIRNSCPHQGADLAEGHISDSKVVCPLHRWSFDLKTGAFSGNENIRVPTYEVKVEKDEVYILWDSE